LNPSRPQLASQASSIFACRARHEFSYSGESAACLEIISNIPDIARMKLQDRGSSRYASLLACILLHRYGLSAKFSSHGWDYDMTAKFRESGAKTTRRAALVGASALALSVGRTWAQTPTPKKGGTARCRNARFAEFRCHVVVLFHPNEPSALSQ